MVLYDKRLISSNSLIMKHSQITETELWAYISKTADATTSRKVEQWMTSDAFDQQLFHQIKGVYTNSIDQTPSIETAKEHFFDKLETLEKPKTYPWKNISKYAAIALIIISGAYFYYSVSVNKNQIVVQTTFGEQKNIALADGSKVWLNASSKLSYNSETPRTLYLEGEGYFEVAKDKLHPFTVTTSDHITVKALGTSFNVKSYKESPTTETKLLTGKVEVSSDTQFKDSYILLPDDKVTFYRNTKEVEKSKMNANESRIAWKEGKIQFENKTFRTIAFDLKAQFGKQIRFKNDVIANAKFTGSFDTTTPIDEIFEILKISRDFEYKLNTETNEWVIK